MTTNQRIESQRFRDLMAGVCAPVTVVTTVEAKKPCGATSRLALP